MKTLFNLCLLAAVLTISCNTKSDSSENLYKEDQSVITSENYDNHSDFIDEKYLKLIREHPEISPSVNGRFMDMHYKATLNELVDLYMLHGAMTSDLINDNESGFALPSQKSFLYLKSRLLTPFQGSYRSPSAYFINYESDIIGSNVNNSEINPIDIDSIQTQSENYAKGDMHKFQDADWDFPIASWNVRELEMMMGTTQLINRIKDSCK